MRDVKAGALRVAAFLPPLIAGVLGALVIVLTFAKFSDEPLMIGDLSTYVLPADFYLRQRDLVYVDFFDIKPPLTYMIFVPWLFLFGKSLLGLWAYYFVWLTLLMIITWFIMRRFLNGWLALIPYFSLSATLVAFSMLEEILFITEVVGLVLALGGLLVLLAWPKSWPAYAIAGLLMVMAGQVKEVFILTPLAVIPAIIIIKQDVLRRVLGFISGSVLALLAVLLGLALWGVPTIPEYLRVLQFKSDRFPAPGPREVLASSTEVATAILSWMPLLWISIAVGVLSLVRLLLNSRGSQSRTVPGSEIRSSRWVTSVFASAIVAAFLWQGAPPLVHYAVALVFPIMIVLAMLVGWCSGAWESSGSRYAKPVFTALVLVGILPAVSSGLWLGGRTTGLQPSVIVANIQNLESDEARRMYTRIVELTTPGQCIQVAYGWAATAAYVYTERDPCSRFVVPPLALDPERIREFQEDLIANPPAALVVDERLTGETTYPDEAGDPDSFVFPFQQVAQTCYQPVPGESVIFTPVYESEMMMSRCIADLVELNRAARTDTQGWIE